MESFSRLLKGTILALLAVLMLLLAALALASLNDLRKTDTDETVAGGGTTETRAADPDATADAQPPPPVQADGTVPLGSDADGSAACIRTGGDGGFVVRVVNPSDEVEPTAVGVRLTMGDRGTMVHTVTVAAGDAGAVGEASVPNSQTATACVVTSTQRGNRVTITGN
ncbi:MAG: hypothetical protein ACK5RL_19880 [Acidimicrobiales bacterium]